jgi:hypothetical protein
MIKINKIVDKVFCITTVNSNRVSYINNHLKKNNIEFEFSIAPEYKIISDKIKVRDSGKVECRPAISLLSAYLSIIEKSRISGYKAISIIEDDCFFSNNWEEKFSRFYSNLPEWDLLNIGYHPIQDRDTIKENINPYVFRPLNHHHTTHCMVMKHTCYFQFLMLMEALDYSLPADYVFNEIYTDKSFNSFSPVEKFIYQLSLRTDFETYNIPGIDTRYKSEILL